MTRAGRSSPRAAENVLPVDRDRAEADTRRPPYDWRAPRHAARVAELLLERERKEGCDENTNSAGTSRKLRAKYASTKRHPRPRPLQVARYGRRTRPTRPQIESAHRCDGSRGRAFAEQNERDLTLEVASAVALDGMTRQNPGLSPDSAARTRPAARDERVVIGGAVVRRSMPNEGRKVFASSHGLT